MQFKEDLHCLRILNSRSDCSENGTQPNIFCFLVLHRTPRQEQTVGESVNGTSMLCLKRLVIKNKVYETDGSGKKSP